MLADGNTRVFDVFVAEVEWSDGPLAVAVFASEAACLVGMSLIDGHKLEIEAVEGGGVKLTRL